MIIGKTACVVALSAALAAIAAPPQLRAGTKKIASKLRSGSKMVALLVKHGFPYHVTSATMRIATLSNVILTTCSENPTGRNACYLVDSAQEAANLAVFANLTEWHQNHVEEWFELLKNDQETANLEKVIHDIYGQDSTGLSSVTLDEFKAMVGAAERSLDDEQLDMIDLQPIFDKLDRNNDEILSMEERAAPALLECDVESNRPLSCEFYVLLLEQYMPSSNKTLEELEEEFVSEGASVREEVSSKFQFLFSS